MTKAEIRNKVLNNRLILKREFVEKNSDIICDKIIKKFPDKNLIVFSYVGVKNEVETSKILSYYNTVYLPKTTDDTLTFCKYDGKLKTGKFQIPEPCGLPVCKDVIPDLIIVPGVGFDRKKNRTGYGKGYYDKFLGNYKNVTKIALAFSFQIFELIDDAESHDIKMDEILTEIDDYE